jgi:hypothetical protein
MFEVLIVAILAVIGIITFIIVAIIKKKKHEPLGEDKSNVDRR